MFLIMGLIIAVIALGLFGGAVWAYISQQRKLSGRDIAAGTVVELNTQVSQRGSIFCPVVEFTASSGEKIKFTSEFGSRPAGYKVGQSVKVRYDSVDPQKAEIESAMTLWLIPIILVFMGVIACCLGVVFLGYYGLGVSP